FPFCKSATSTPHTTLITYDPKHQASLTSLMA
ncbi:hypothetical protein glysoja_038218, partial [Glycine soja]